MSKHLSAQNEPRMGKGRSASKRLPSWVSETGELLTDVYAALREQITAGNVSPLELIAIARDAREALIQREALIESGGDE